MRTLCPPPPSALFLYITFGAADLEYTSRNMMFESLQNLHQLRHKDDISIHTELENIQPRLRVSFLMVY